MVKTPISLNLNIRYILTIFLEMSFFSFFFLSLFIIVTSPILTLIIVIHFLYEVNMFK